MKITRVQLTCPGLDAIAFGRSTTLPTLPEWCYQPRVIIYLSKYSQAIKVGYMAEDICKCVGIFQSPMDNTGIDSRKSNFRKPIWFCVRAYEPMLSSCQINEASGTRYARHNMSNKVNNNVCTVSKASEQSSAMTWTKVTHWSKSDGGWVILIISEG